MDLILLLMAVCGIIIHILMEYVTSLTNKTELNWKRSVIYAIASILLMVVIVLNIDEWGVVLGLHIGRLSMFFIGYASDSMVKNISKYSPIKIE